MRKRSTGSVAFALRSNVAAVVAASLRRRRSRSAEFHANRKGPLSRHGGRLRRLPHRAERRQAVRRRPADRDAVRQYHLAEHHAGSRHRHRRLDRRPIRQRGAQRHPARWLAALSGDALHRLHQDVARRRRRDPRLSQTLSSRCTIRLSPTRCRSRSISAPRCAFGTGSISPRASSSPIRSKSAEWNRGAFLVEGPGHCGACHTPKSFLGGDKNSEYLQGSHLQGWFAPDITNDEPRGLGALVGR